ncbi:MAG: hypothetical protein KatS3mg029_0566 [Saprospiraceae bacterium]|nr:MAG: hypothetical protein KatS3mg029_0566 [Saprospiraceae bacterium]
MTKKKSEKEKLKRKLVAYFFRNVYLRKADPEKRKTLGQAYKKGYEIRLVAYDEKEKAEIIKLLKTFGFKHGRAFVKSRRTVLPIYGKKQVEEFYDLIMSLSRSSNRLGK